MAHWRAVLGIVAFLPVAGTALAQETSDTAPTAPGSDAALSTEARAAPAATEPDATEPDATEPDATEPDATEPDATEPEPSDDAVEAPTSATAQAEAEVGTEASLQATAPAPEPPQVAAQGATSSAATSTGVEDAAPEAEPSSEFDAVPARIPWRGTAFLWAHDVTTSAVGIGGTTISDAHEVYVQSFNWLVNYFLVDTPDFKLRVAVAPGFDVELTNSNSTTNLHEPQLQDLPVSVVGSMPLYQKKGSSYATGLIGNYTTIFPLSETSQGTGQYLVTSPRLLLYQVLPLLGEDSAFLKSATFGLSGRWDHTFSQAEFPVNSRIQRPRQTFNGNTFTDDVLSGDPLSHDSLRAGVFVFLSEEIFEHPLWIQASFGLAHDLLYTPSEDYCHLINGQCIQPDGLDNPQTTRTRTSLGVSLTYFPVPEIGVSLGYANSSNQLGPDGQYRNPFYSPGAVFHASLGFSIDALYERMTGPPRSEPYLLLGKRRQRPSEPNRLFF